MSGLLNEIERICGGSTPQMLDTYFGTRKEMTMDDLFVTPRADLIKEVTSLLEKHLGEDGETFPKAMQEFIDMSCEPIQPGAGKYGAWVRIELSGGGYYEDNVAVSRPINISEVFWRYEEDCWRSQADLILALEGSVQALKSKFSERFGFPFGLKELHSKATEEFPDNPDQTFWPDGGLLREVVDVPFGKGKE